MAKRNSTQDRPLKVLLTPAEKGMLINRLIQGGMTIDQIASKTGYEPKGIAVLRAQAATVSHEERA